MPEDFRRDDQAACQSRLPVIKRFDGVSPMDSIGDRRKHPRFPVHLPVSIFYKEKRAVGHTLDVGLGGMKIYTDQILPSRWELLFQLVLGGKFIWVKGRFVFAQTQP